MLTQVSYLTKLVNLGKQVRKLAKQVKLVYPTGAMSDYEEGYQAGRNASDFKDSYQAGKAAGSLLSGIIILSFRVLVETLVAAPFLLLGLAITMHLDFLGPGFGYARIVSIGVVGYCFYALLYILKGVGIGLRLRGGWYWLVPFTICLLAACLVPALLLHLFMAQAVKAVHPLLVWGVPALFALYTYNRYRFTQDYAPNWALWAYRRGYQWGLRKV